MNKFKVLLMYSSLLDIPAKDGKPAFNGLSVEYYFFGENGEMVKSNSSADGVSGARRGKSILDPEMYNKVSFVPGIYDGTFEMSVNSDGKPILTLVDIDYVAKASITALEEKPAK